MLKCKPDIIPLNVLRLILKIVGVSQRKEYKLLETVNYIAIAKTVTQIIIIETVTQIIIIETVTCIIHCRKKTTVEFATELPPA